MEETVVKNVKKIILKTNIKREPNKLYFCGTDENNNLLVCETMMTRGKKQNQTKS